MNNDLTVSSLVARADSESRPPAFKAVGISLAVASGVFIGISFVMKKLGLLKANVKYNEEAGEGYGYLKNAYWWGGMTLMIIGEICNFVAYAFVDAILVTPLGALSVVVTTVLSAIFLKERLSFVGKVGCFSCLVGSVVIAMNAPAQSSVTNIQDMKDFVIQPGFLAYAGVVIVGCVFLALWAGPRYGKQSMFVYLTICSLIGGLSVVATQGLGAAIIAQISGKSQFKEWFLYVLLVFVITTLLTEIIYLNKALNLFNAALVTPTYYVIFTSATIVTSAVLFQGFKGSPITIATVVMGFLQICSGVVLLQLSKSAKDVPDAAIFKGDLDQVREVAEQEEPESEPKADAIRGAAAIIRRISTPRQKWERNEVRRYQSERRLDETEPLDENDVVEWDGLRRRKTVLGSGPATTPRRMKTLHPPLGMSRFPNDIEEEPLEKTESQDSRGQRLMEPFQYDSNYTRARSRSFASGPFNEQVRGEHAPLSPGYNSESPPPTPPPHNTRRQFSFQNVFHRGKSSPSGSSIGQKSPNLGGKRFTSYSRTPEQRRAMKSVTEEETLGLVEGDGSQELTSRTRPPSYTDHNLELPKETLPRAPQQPSRSHHYSSSDEENTFK